ncbi:MAG: M20/M25/M40 family metallo-hydrolase [Fimbriimonas sp.]
MKSIRFLSTLAFASISLASQAQGDPQTIARIIDEGKNHSQAMSILTHITKKIGPRLTGSNKLARGEEWAMSEFRRFGCTNVHLEKWGDVPVGFERGALQTARMVAPYDVPMVFTTSSWTNGTNGIVTADAVYAPKTMAELNERRSELAGKWVVMPPQAGGRPQPGAPAPATEASQVAAELNKMNIAGMIRGSRNELVITGGSWRDKTFESHPGAVSVLVRKSDYDRITRNLDWKRKVVLAIGAENHWIKGPMPQHVVVAEIKGTEKPEEVVIVSGHFDSWDGPGSEGASDNGTGSATALEAARILNKVGAKPKRTIRFILWTGEEQGLYGSTEYVKQHAGELDKISAVLVDDGGSNYQGGYVVLESMKPMFEQAIAPMLTAFPDYPQVLRVVPTMPRGGGSDHVPFNNAGVPGFFTMETGKQDYNFVHHTQHDHLGNVIPEYIVQSATNHAVVAYNLACAATMVPRAPKPAPAGG